MPKAKLTTPDDYFAALPPEQRAAFQKLLKQVMAAVPRATQHIWYNLPTLKLDDRPLVCFRAAAKHCAMYVMSPTLLAANKELLNGLDWSGGTIRFKPGEPIPAAIVKKLLKARVAEMGPA